MRRRAFHRTPLARSCCALSSAVVACAALVAGPAAQAAVFVNEIHYDDATASGDTGERIEVVATAGESLGGYRIVLYNGATPSAAKVYDDDPVPSGSLVSCGASVRVAVLNYPSNGLQNGAPDGLALIDGGGRVVQFLSYEGTLTASDGPAAGHSSSALPVSESGATSAGTSLQLAGSGDPATFAWRASAAQTFGGCNHDQVFGSSGNPPPEVTATTPTQGSSDFPAAGDLAVNFSEPVTLAGGAFALACSVSGNVALAHADSGSSFTLGTGTALHAGEHCLFTIAAAKVSDAGGAHPAQDTAIDFAVADGGGGGDEDYYARVNASSPSQLRCSLHETIKGHTVYPYSASGTDTWDILEIADEDPSDPGRILDVYRNRSYAKGSDRAGTGSGLSYNREHTWPNSLGFGSATGDRGLPYAPYTDTHMLYLSDAAYNADRGNKPYAGCSSGCGARATEANGGYGGGGGRGDQNWVRTPDGNAGSFEVWDHRKGDMARAVLYMAIRYEGGDDANGQSEPDLELTDDRSRIVKTSASPAYMGLLSTLLAWHRADPPDAAERARNEVIFSFQGNRNPFIDHPEWATQGLFTSAQPQTCQLN